MKKAQWYTLGIGLILFSFFMFFMTSPGCYGLNSGDLVIACTIRRYSYAIPALISFIVGILFMICGGYER